MHVVLTQRTRASREGSESATNATGCLSYNVERWGLYQGSFPMTASPQMGFDSFCPDPLPGLILTSPPFLGGYCLCSVEDLVHMETCPPAN